MVTDLTPILFWLACSMVAGGERNKRKREREKRRRWKGEVKLIYATRGLESKLVAPIMRVPDPVASRVPTCCRYGDLSFVRLGQVPIYDSNLCEVERAKMSLFMSQCLCDYDNHSRLALG